MTRRTRAISFISEHTAEYVLVPQICSVFSSHYKAVIPFYFWATREGSSVSYIPERVQLVSVFARRPKVIQPGGEDITVKFNDLLFDIARLFSTLGIPVLAGVPVVSSLGNLRLDSRCAWFLISGNTDEPTDVECRLSIAEDRVEFTGDRGGIEGPLSDTEIRSYCSERASRMPWDKAVGGILSVRRSIPWPLGPFWAARGPYKPFYLALLNRTQ